MGRFVRAAAIVAAGMAMCGPAQAEEPAYPGWGGFYAGISGGQSSTTAQWRTTSARYAWGPTYPYGIDSRPESFALSPSRVAVYAGFNYMVSPVVMIGLEADAGRGRDKVRKGQMPGLNTNLAMWHHTAARVSSGSDASLRMRAGYVLLPRLLVYGTAGYAVQNFRQSVNCVLDYRVCNPDYSPQNYASSKRLHGRTAGIGVEYQLMPNLIARLEYRRTEYASTEFTAMPYVYFRTHGIQNKLSATSDTGTLGLALKF